MKVAKTVASFRVWRKCLSGRVVFVPTMGALHRGHAELIRSARAVAGRTGSVVVSLFVNPAQFGPKEDFAAYPRPWRKDLAVCRAAGTDAVFLPAAEEMYFPDRSTTVGESLLSDSLCGRSRPGHFCGVCTVVAKLFHVVQPTHAVFGEKDWQQLAIIRRMVRDLNFPVEVFGHPTVREPDGLAASSRNACLSPAERAAAPLLYAALQQAASSNASPPVIVARAKKSLGKIPLARVDYVEAVDAESLRPLKNRQASGRLAAAVFFGRTRLIDNIPLPATHARI
ncbi:MAG: pantoate--beta-alanine ligase [Verrucomicrobiae bacterium]